MSHIFGIGLNKTGTNSLSTALETLGFTTLHNDKATIAAIQRALDEGVPLLTYAERVDAYLDMYSVQQKFDLLDAQYPGSRFILTTRSLDAWLASREKHVRSNQERADAGTYPGQWLTVDVERWTQLWHKHHARVRAYFAGRDDLLEIDLASGDGWDALAPFLGRPIPETAFPWRNRRNATASQRVRQRFTQLRRGSNRA